MIQASTKLPSLSIQTMSQYRTQANLSCTMLRSFRSMHLELVTMSETSVLVTWALSEGGPGLYFDEHNGGSSTFVTRKPTSGSSAFGVASSCKVRILWKLSLYAGLECNFRSMTEIKITSLIPHTTVVFPHLTTAEASAAFTELTFNLMFRCSWNALPSGRMSLDK